VFLVAGANSPLIAAFVANPWIRPRLIVVRLSDRANAGRRLAVPTLDVSSAENFVARWKVGRYA
jgi:hypothetical protein